MKSSLCCSLLTFVDGILRRVLCNNNLSGNKETYIVGGEAGRTSSV